MVSGILGSEIGLVAKRLGSLHHEEVHVSYIIDIFALVDLGLWTVPVMYRVSMMSRTPPRPRSNDGGNVTVQRTCTVPDSSSMPIRIYPSTVTLRFSEFNNLISEVMSCILRCRGQQQ